MDKIGANAANSEPTDEDIQKSLSIFNSWLLSKSNEILNVHQIYPAAFYFNAGQYSYTIGPATDDSGNPTNADWVTERPVRIEKFNLVMGTFTISGNEVVNDPNGATIYLPIEKQTTAEFADIRMRGITNALPTKCIDIGGYPVRTIQFYPVPSDSTKACELWLWEPVQIYTLDSYINMPDGYERYYIYGLAMELCDVFAKTPTPEMITSFAEAESVVKILNQVTWVTQASDAMGELNKKGRIYHYIDFVSGACMLPRNVR